MCERVGGCLRVNVCVCACRVYMCVRTSMHVCRGVSVYTRVPVPAGERACVYTCVHVGVYRAVEVGGRDGDGGASRLQKA